MGVRVEYVENNRPSDYYYFAREIYEGHCIQMFLTTLICSLFCAEGPKLFCRSVDLSEEKDSWEDRRRLLLEVSILTSVI